MNLSQDTQLLEQWQHLVGKKIVSKDDAKELSTAEFYREDLPQPYRVLGPMSPCTMDFRPNRLNVIVDANGVCERVDVC
ncbi:Peptidase inhibitor I78 family protein [Yarrowia sp. B02]|nr:Peptidase inhibitor I78 family protein [Yarrowia sp. B02]